MSRQDIYGELSDDILGKTGHTSSQKGKVHDITIDINTDVAGKGSCAFIFMRDSKNVRMRCDLPEKWVIDIEKKKDDY